VSLSFPKLVPPDSEFCVAIRAGDLDRVQEQLRSGQASVADIVAPYGLTPLSLAILYGKGELCQLLIREGANLFGPDHTWLISDVYDFFLGFSLCRSSISARAVIQDIVRRSSSQEQMAALRMCMLEPGFRAFSFPRLHKSVLGLTTESLDILATISRLQINEIDITGRTALHWVVYNEDVSSIHTLICCGSDPSIRDHEGVTPLHVAASLGSVTCIQTLLRAGADPHSRDRLGLTPLHHAAAQGHEEAIRLLVTAGASWSAKGAVADIPIAYAIYAGHSHAVEVLLECGSSLECKDRYGYTSILDATFTDSHQSLDALTRMAQVGAKLFDGKTILHIAAANSDAKTIEILQNARLTGVDIDAVDNAGFTAMQYIRRRSDGEELVEPFGALLISVTPEVREPFEDLTEDSEEFFDVFEF
jgi:ankyrin repeat protein